MSTPKYFSTPVPQTTFLLSGFQGYLAGHISFETMIEVVRTRHLTELNTILCYAVLERGAMAPGIQQRFDDWVWAYLQARSPRIQPFQEWLRLNAADYISHLERRSSERERRELEEERHQRQQSFHRKLQQLVQIHQVALSWGITESHVEQRIRERRQLRRLVKASTDPLNTVIEYYTGMPRTALFEHTVTGSTGTPQVIIAGRAVQFVWPEVVAGSELLFGISVLKAVDKTILWIEWALGNLFANLCLKSTAPSTIELATGYLFGHRPKDDPEPVADLTASLGRLQIAPAPATNPAARKISPANLKPRKITRRKYPTSCSVEEFRQLVKVDDKVTFTGGISARTRFVTDDTTGKVKNVRGARNCTVKLLRRNEFLYVPWNNITSLNDNPISIV